LIVGHSDEVVSGDLGFFVLLGAFYVVLKCIDGVFVALQLKVAGSDVIPGLPGAGVCLQYSVKLSDRRSVLLLIKQGNGAVPFLRRGGSGCG
jgi:hypothetical protein